MYKQDDCRHLHQSSERSKTSGTYQTTKIGAIKEKKKEEDINLRGSVGNHKKRHSQWVN